MCGNKKLANDILAIIAIAYFPLVSSQSLDPDTCSQFGIRATTPSIDFRVVGNGGVVLHIPTGLEWKRCSYGMTWDGSACIGEASGGGWATALDIAVNASGSWRLPNIKELQSIVERCREFPAINAQAFPNTVSSNYWSSTPDPSGQTGSYYHVSFGNGDTDLRFFGGVRLVREASNN